MTPPDGPRPARVSGRAEVSGRVVGVTRLGEEVTETVLANGRVRAAVWNYGATLVSVRVPDRTGADREVVLGLPGLADHEAVTGRAYVGSTMGRFARIVGRGHLPLDGRRHQLAVNAGEHHIHGGPEGFDARVWSVSRATSGGRARVVLTLHSPDGDQGYPGALDATTVYELDEHDRLTVTFTAVTDAPTICGLSTHTFWNLADAPTVDGHRLHVVPRHRLEADDEFLPTGRVLETGGPAPGLAPGLVSHGREEDVRLGDVPIDTCLVLPGSGPGPEVELARLRDPGTGIGLVVRSDQSAMAVYTGDHLPGRPRAGICLQPGPWPDSPNQPGFPSARLRPGETYRSRTTFALLVPAPEVGGPA